MELFVLFACGIAVGVLGALLGIGGGVLLVPVLVYLVKVPIHHAIAISLISIIATSAHVASFGIKQGFTNIRLGLFLEIFSTSGAILSSILAVKMHGDILTRIFALSLIITSFFMFYQPRNSETPEYDEKELKYFGGTFFDPTRNRMLRYNVQNLPAVTGLTFLAGVLSGMVGTSGGVFMVPLMKLLGKIPMRAAADTSSLLIGVTALGGAITYFRAGYVEVNLLAPIVMGIMAGVFVGNRLKMKVKSVWLKRMFALILVITAIKMFMG